MWVGAIQKSEDLDGEDRGNVNSLFLGGVIFSSYLKTRYPRFLLTLRLSLAALCPSVLRTSSSNRESLPEFLGCEDFNLCVSDVLGSPVCRWLVGELLLCLPFFSVALIKSSDTNNLKQGGFSLAHSPKATVPVVGQPRGQELEPGDYFTSAVRGREQRLHAC